MRRTLTLAVLAVLLTAWSADAQTGVVVPANHQQLYIPAMSAPLLHDTAVLAPSADRRRPRILPALYFSLAVLQGADLYSTHAATARGASELNPLVNTVGGGPAAQTAVRAALTTSSILLAERLWKKKKRVAAVVAMVAANGLMVFAVHHNIQNIR